MSASLSVCVSVVVSVGLSVGAGAGVASVGLSLLSVHCSVGVGKNSRESLLLVPFPFSWVLRSLIRVGAVLSVSVSLSVPKIRLLCPFVSASLKVSVGVSIGAGLSLGAKNSSTGVDAGSCQRRFVSVLSVLVSLSFSIFETTISRIDGRWRFVSKMDAVTIPVVVVVDCQCLLSFMSMFIAVVELRNGVG